MKKNKPALLFVFALLLFHTSFCQEVISVEARIGTGNTQFNYLGDFPELAVTSGSNLFLNVGVFISGKGIFTYGMELEYYKFGVNFTYLPLDPIRKTGGALNDFWALGPKIQKDFKLFPNAGISLANAFHVSYNTQETYQFQGGELQIVRSSNGDPRIPVKIYGNRDIQEFSFFLKPELSLFYDLNENSRIMVSGKLGLDLREPSIVIDLDRIEFEGQTYQNKYFYSGNYFSALLGYRYTF
ncbi:hypothetical protein [Algoriphagus formosus]|uniref:hypothetical protein n=1 Tax=Algoriphagus formosus TaxID=2007308 RepID=UPI000C292105|nr:hypothetical protein [Algoriphagus formosus]